MNKKASLIVHINSDGEVIHVRNVDLTPVQYGEKEKKAKKSMIGAKLYTPNGCCWQQLRGNGWVCGPC